MPDFPIVDAHVHLWDPEELRIPWLDGNPTLEQRFGPDEYRQHSAGVEVAAFVYVQVDVAPAYALVEARRAAAHAAADPRLRAVVAYAPLEDGRRARSYLEELVRVSPLVRGVRRITQGEPDPAFCLRPGFVEGVRLLPEYGLTCDLCLLHHQLGPAVELVRRCPEVQFMLDHLAKPGVREGALSPWREQLAELAALPNVCCKISGVVTEADHAAWTPAQLAPYIAHALAVFGEGRVAFGSDWPVVLLAGGYRRWVETLDGLTAHLGAGARRKLWAENARRFYGLNTA
ncbi:MAG TPA: amidohydrolase family protein [Roseiflexaceae bacterium]|nr:amidohydrolase family protein [Roseiflexaceae bacterium]